MPEDMFDELFAGLRVIYPNIRKTDAKFEASCELLAKMGIQNDLAHAVNAILYQESGLAQGKPGSRELFNKAMEAAASRQVA